jgi:hypothetical protein
MLNLSVDKAVIAIVEAMLPTFSKDRGLAVKISASISPDVKEDKRAYREIQMVFQRKAAYTSVFVASRSAHAEPLTFTLASHHDSCWKTDGFQPLNTLYFDMCEEAAPGVAPVKCHQYVTIEKVVPLDSISVEKGPEPYGPNRLLLKDFRGV